MNVLPAEDSSLKKATRNNAKAAPKETRAAPASRKKHPKRPSALGQPGISSSPAAVEWMMFCMKEKRYPKKSIFAKRAMNQNTSVLKNAALLMKSRPKITIVQTIRTNTPEPREG